MKEENVDYKRGFIDGMKHDKIMMDAVIQVNIDFSDILSLIKLKGDEVFILPKQEDKKNDYD